MTIKEAKAATTKWLKSKGFRPVKIHGRLPNLYLHSIKNIFEDFNVMIGFYKDRFGDYYLFDVGCLFENVNYGKASIGVRSIPSNKEKILKMADGRTIRNTQAFYYGDMTEDEYLKCLDEIFEKYLKPFYEQGVNYLREIILNESLFGEGYSIERDARDIINKLCGLKTKVPK